jgi:hypothetical protein
MVLLAFLCLTVPFHDELVQRFHTPREAAEYYYLAAKKELGDVLDEPTIERIQTMLMIGMYEWSMLKGPMAWRTVGIAIRCAHQLALHIDDDREAERYDHIDSRTGTCSKGESRFIEAEIRRRTYWACFIMDRYLSGGKYRPSDIKLADVRIQLPCSDRAFNIGKSVRTNWFTPNDDSNHGASTAKPLNLAAGSPALTVNGETPPVELGEAPQCHYIRALELFKHYLAWSVQGGRRYARRPSNPFSIPLNRYRRDEDVPPWDESSHLALYERELEMLREKLGDESPITQHVISAHIAENSAAAYTLVKALHLLCLIVLHREYIPFVALNCREGPIGPLDGFRFPDSKERREYWVQSSQKCFEAARDLAYLFCELDKADSLVETPLSMFTAHNVAVCGTLIL